MIDSCKNPVPLKNFLVSRCKFNSERAEKVIERAQLLKQHKDAAGVGPTSSSGEEKAIVISSDDEQSDNKGYTEQIQAKRGWEQLKTEVKSFLIAGDLKQ